MPDIQGSFSIDFDTSDFRGLVGHIRRFSLEAADYALLVVANELLRDAQLYVPVLSGRLRDSGRVEDMPEPEGAHIRRVRVVYGNADVMYAWIQHEVPYNHPSLGLYGPAKYLETPLMMNHNFYMSLFAVEYDLYLSRSYGR